VECTTGRRCRPSGAREGASFGNAVARYWDSVAVDSSAFFTSDRGAVRVTMRVGFAFPHEAAVVRVKRDDAP
jgi:hypothetical protein